MSKTYLCFFNNIYCYQEIIEGNDILYHKILEFEKEMSVDSKFEEKFSSNYTDKSSICWEFSEDDLFYVLLKYPEIIDSYIEKE